MTVMEMVNRYLLLESATEESATKISEQIIQQMISRNLFDNGEQVHLIDTAIEVSIHMNDVTKEVFLRMLDETCKSYGR